MDEVALALVAAGLIAGLTGTWSPCGFSMIDTIGPRGHEGGRAVTIAACAAFAIGAPIGGAITFGLLALLGQLAVGAAGELAYLVAAAVAVAAAIADARGAPIRPQIRRQLPEAWRRNLPMSIAGFGYGILLGLGFTTFVLSFGVWALAAISFALGEPATGLAIGVAFGVGRALPICAIAPIANRPAGIRAVEAMANRPGLLRGARLGDAAALVVVGVALVAGGRASVAETAEPPPPVPLAKIIEDGAADPAAAGSAIAFQAGSARAAVMRASGKRYEVAGTDPALGGPWLATIAGGEIILFNRGDLSQVSRLPAPNADAVAVSQRWLVWRSRSKGRDHIAARRISAQGKGRKRRPIDGSGKDGQLGRPALDGAKLAYARAGGGRNSIVLRRLGGGGGKRLVTSDKVGLSNPALSPGNLVYVRTTRKGDALKRRGLGGRGKGRTIYQRNHARLWSTAIQANRVLVTVMKGNPPRSRVVEVKP